MIKILQLRKVSRFSWSDYQTVVYPSRQGQSQGSAGLDIQKVPSLCLRTFLTHQVSVFLFVYFSFYFSKTPVGSQGILYAQGRRRHDAVVTARALCRCRSTTEVMSSKMDRRTTVSQLVFELDVVWRYVCPPKLPSVDLTSERHRFPQSPVFIPAFHSTSITSVSPLGIYQARLSQ